jgi:chemotaxis response regulator CheB
MTKRLHLCISGTLLHDTNITWTGTANGKARSDLLCFLRSYTDCASGPNTAATSECATGAAVCMVAVGTSAGGAEADASVALDGTAAP